MPLSDRATSVKKVYFSGKNGMDREKLLEIARTYGTPAYVYDLGQVRERYLRLKSALEGAPARIHYAVKANAHPAILRTLAEMGAGADCVSAQEVEAALEAGFRAEDILFTPSCPSEDELARALDAGVKVHIGALEYLPWLAEHYPGHPVGLRLNPGVQAGGNRKIATAHAGSKFGIPWTHSDELLQTVKALDLRIEGLHVHLGSDVHSTEDLKRGVDFLTGVAGLFPGLRYLDFGSGLKVKYHPEDPEIDVEEYARYIRKRMKAFPHLGIKWEPGKYLVADSGVFLMRVNVVKRGAGKVFAGVNTGFNHMIRPMYYDAYHHIENLSHPRGEPLTYDIVGNLCEEDTFARDRQVARIRPGDILALRHAGAYGYVMASRYNLRPLPREIIVDGDKVEEA